MDLHIPDYSSDGRFVYRWVIRTGPTEPTYDLDGNIIPSPSSDRPEIDGAAVDLKVAEQTEVEDVLAANALVRAHFGLDPTPTPYKMPRALLHKLVIISRLTDGQLAATEAARANLPLRAQVRWAATDYIDTDDPGVRAFYTSVIGAVQAARVLRPFVIPGEDA